MRIDELDEFQGLTPQLVTDWLLANGWTQTKPGWWERGEDGFLFDSQTFDQQWFWVHALVAVYECCGVQALLRMINPRMRGPGYPSDAAARAHGNGGWWVFQHQQGADDPRSVTKPGELHTAQMCLSSAFNDVRFYWERGLMGEPCDEACMWWPCVMLV
jgi:hypothetical protein